MKQKNQLLSALAFGIMCSCISYASASGTHTVTPASQIHPDLGKVIYGTSASTFHIDAATGAMTQTSGNAYRVTGSGSTLTTLTITCTVAPCAGIGINRVKVDVACVSNSPATLTVNSVNTSGYGGVHPAAATLQFFVNSGEIINIGNTLNLGMDVTFQPNLVTTGVISPALTCTITAA